MRGSEPGYASGEAGRPVARGNRAGRGGVFRPLGERQTVSRVRSIVGVAGDDVARLLPDLLGAGVAIMLAPTSDGGACSVTVFDGDDKSRTYCSSPEEFAEALGAVRDYLASRRP